MRSRGLERVQEVVKRQERVAAERRNDRILLGGEDGGMNGLRPRHGIGGLLGFPCVCGHNG